MKAVRFAGSLGLACIVLAIGSSAAPVNSGNILISTEEVLYEYSPGGVFVQSFAIPYATGPRPVTESARDIAVKLGETDVHVYNGTFTPYVSTLDSSASTWSHETLAGFSTVANVSYGGVAVGGQYVFATDMATAGVGAPQGIIRFDSGGATRFATGIAPIDLNVGLDGLLYALHNDQVYIFDPETMAQQQVINLDSTIGSGDYRAVAVNAADQMFVVTWTGTLYKTDSSGSTLLSVNLVGTASGNLTDVDVSDSGMVVVGDSGGGVTITDESLTSPTSFTIGSSTTFVAMALNPPVGVPISPIAVYILMGVLLIVAAISTRKLRLRPYH